MVSVCTFMILGQVALNSALKHLVSNILTRIYTQHGRPLRSRHRIILKRYTHVTVLNYEFFISPSQCTWKSIQSTQGVVLQENNTPTQIICILSPLQYCKFEATI